MSQGAKGCLSPWQAHWVPRYSLVGDINLLQLALSLGSLQAFLKHKSPKHTACACVRVVCNPYVYVCVHVYASFHPQPSCLSVMCMCVRIHRSPNVCTSVYMCMCVRLSAALLCVCACTCLSVCSLCVYTPLGVHVLPRPTCCTYLSVVFHI